MGSPQFPPIPLRMEYQSDGSAKSAFLADIAAITGDTRRQFESAFAEVGQVASNALGAVSGKKFKIDLDLSAMRQAAADADFAEKRLIQLRDAATQLAQSTGDTSRSTHNYLQALRAQTLEAGAARAAAQEQVTTYTRLQSEIDKARFSVIGLKDAFRETFAEQARAANSAEASQRFFNSLSAPGLTRSTSAIDPNDPSKGVRINSARESARAFEELFAAEDAAAESAKNVAAAAKAAAAETERLATAANELRSRLDPTVAIQQKFERELTQAERLLAAGTITTKEFAAAQSFLATELQQSYAALTRAADAEARVAREGTTAERSVINSAGSRRFAYQQLGQQIQDVGIQAQLGTNAFVIFGQQVPQAAFALSGLADSSNKAEAKVGQLATFLSGPWGAAIFIAVSALGPLVAQLFRFGSALDEAVEKLRKSALESETARRAQLVFDQTLEGSIIIQRKLNEELERELSTRGQIIRQRADTAQVGLADAKSERASAKAEVDRLTAALAEAKSRNQRPFLLTEQLAAAQKRFGDADNLVALAERNAAASRAVVIQQQTRESLDPKLASRSKLENQASDLLTRFQAGLITEAEYGAAFRKIQAGLDALSKTADSATAASRQFGREIDIAGAKAIAQRAGFRVTSDYRPAFIKDEVPGGPKSQERLYNTVRTAQNPVAFPDANAPHVRGNALDIAFGPGVSPKSIRDAFAAEGVRLTKLLKETGHYHIEFSTSGADKVAKEVERLATFGQQAAESIQSINERFNEQPRLIDSADAATRKLNDTIAELALRKPPGFQQLIADAEVAKGVIQEALVRPFAELERDAGRRVAIQQLQVTGRIAEANALQDIYRLESLLGPLTDQRKADVFAVAQAEQAANEALAKQQEIIGAYLDATRSIRGEVEAILSGTGKLSNLKNVFQQLRGRVLTEALFGDVFRDLEKYIRRNSGIEEATDKLVTQTGRAGDAALAFADALAAATSRVGGSTPSTIALGAGGDAALQASVAATLSLPNVLRVFGAGGAANDNSAPGSDAADGGIVVNGRRPVGTSLNPIIFAEQVGQRISGGFADALRNVGIRLSPQATGVLGGALTGYLTAGPAGGIIGALKEIPGLPKGIAGALGKAGAGLQTGAIVSGVAGAFGVKLNGTGSQIGGAIGSFLPIPGGQIIGSIAGGLIGNLFSKAKTGASAIGVNQFGIAGVTGTGGNNAAARDASKGLGGAVSDQLNQIAEALGADLGQFNVAIGSRKDYFRVSASGSISSATKKKPGADVIYDGKDQNAAIAAAVQNAIEDGAITGISAASQAILRSGQDLNRAIQKAVAIESIPKQLKALTNPVGAAVDTLNQQFEKLVASLKEGGATADQFAEAKQLYDLQRAAAIKQASDQVSSSLTNLLDSLTVNNQALSLTDRRAAALAKLNPLETRLRAGDISSFSDFSSAAQTLIGIERQISGSQTDFFALVDRITSETSAAVEKQRALADAATASDSPFAGANADNASVVNALNSQTEQTTTLLKAINDNLIALGLRTGTTSGQSIPSFSASFF